MQDFFGFLFSTYTSLHILDNMNFFLTTLYIRVYCYLM